MVRHKHFRRFHNYLLGCASELVAPVLRGTAKLVISGAQSPPNSWRRGLILSNTRIGDVLFRTCSLEQLKNGLPNCEWHYLTSADSAEMLRNNPFLTSAVPLCGPTGAPRLLPGAAKKLRAMSFDVALCTNPETYWRDQMVALAAGIPNRVGFIHRGLSGLVTHPVPCSYPSPWAGYFQQIVSHLTGAAPGWTLIPRIYPSEEDDCSARLQWKRMELPADSPVVICFMTTREQSHIWPEEFFSQALKQVQADGGVCIVLAGSSQDAPVLRQFAARCGFPSRVMAGDLGLRGLFCFFRMCAVTLCPDSGPRHIANAAGTPAVFMRNLFCSKVETGRYCPNEIDLSPDVEFVPLNQQEACLRRVSPTIVAQTILQILRR